MEELQITMQDIYTYLLANTTAADMTVNIYVLDHVSEEFLLFDTVIVPAEDSTTVQFTADGVFSFGYNGDTQYYIVHVYKILRDCIDNYIREMVTSCDPCEVQPLNQLMRIWLTAQTYWNMLERLPQFDHVHFALPSTQLGDYTLMSRIIEEMYRYCVKCAIVDMTEVIIPEDATPEEIAQFEALRLRLVWNSSLDNTRSTAEEHDIVFVPSFRMLEHCGCS